MAKEKFINDVTVEGYLYDFKLEEKKVQNEKSDNFGKPYITGTLDVATDEATQNIVQVHYSFVPPTYKSGKENRSFKNLQKIMNDGATVLTSGKDGATKVLLSTSLATNDWYTDQNGQLDEPELVSAKRLEGGFVNINKSFRNDEEKKRSYFKADFLIYKYKVIEADEEKNIPDDYMKIYGWAFDFAGRAQPMDFNIHSKGGMQYFEGLEPSKKNPVFTKVWGSVVSQQVKVSKSTESAWGDDDTVEYTNTHREYVVTGTASEPYDDDKAFTVDEMKEKAQAREVYLAGLLENWKKYQEEKKKGGKSDNGGNTKEEAEASASEGGFNFF